MTTSPHKILVRPGLADDADELFRLAGLLATSAVPERQAFDSSLRTILSDHRQCLLVAVSGSEVTGYVYGLFHPAFHANGNIGWIEELYVEEQLRGSGAGRLLMDRFEEWAIESAGARYFAVATRRAGDFYRSIGYEESANYFKKTAASEPHSQQRRQLSPYRDSSTAMINKSRTWMSVGATLTGCLESSSSRTDQQGL